MASNKKKETADMENKISNPNVKELEQTRTKKDDERAKRKRRAVSLVKQNFLENGLRVLVCGAGLCALGQWHFRLLLQLSPAVQWKSEQDTPLA